MDEIKKDPRFSHVLKDTRFKKLRKKHVKVKVDKRFQSMFSDKKFEVKQSVDKRGRPVNIQSDENLKRYYDVSDLSDESVDDNSENEINEVSKVEKDSLSKEVKKKLKDLKVDYARGEGRILSDSSSDEEVSDAEDDGNEFDHNWGELDKDAPLTEDATSRLAVCNMDWDRIKAKDLMVLFSSFIPTGGAIQSVSIYPSEFGQTRMKEEEEKGPAELVENENNEEEEDEVVRMEKLRQYQLNRLKYFYAVMICDSTATANHIYTECDGMEYESSNNRLDLRFIPDDTTFDQEPREVATQLNDLSNYRPRLFTTTALTQAKVELTWDETDPSRHEAVKMMHSGKVNEEQVRSYLACSSSEDEDEDDDKEDTQPEHNLENGKSSEKDVINKYKLLLAEIEDKKKKRKDEVMNMEVTWDLGAEKKTAEVVKDTLKSKEKSTPFEKYIEKRKEKKKMKKSLKKAEDPEDQQDAFSDDDIPSDIDLNDPYFKEEMKSSKKKKKPADEATELDNAEAKLQAAEMELLLLDSDTNEKHFNMKTIVESQTKQKKKKLRGKKKNKDQVAVKEDDFKVDVNDDRFSAIYSSHHFNIDPSDPQYKATRGTNQLIEEKQKRRAHQVTNKKEDKKQAAELTMLVKSIKRKAGDAMKKENKKVKKT